MTYSNSDSPGPARFLGWVAVTAVALFLVVGLIIVSVMGFKSVGRSQALKNAENQVRISNIQIRNQKQRIVIAKQKAEIRRQDAVGIREAQEEIAKTLTPLYVQFEMTQVLLAIARSGNNNSIVYLPSGEAGIPLITAEAGTGL